MKTNKQALFFALFTVISVCCWAGGSKENGTVPQTEQQTAPQTQPVQQTVPQSAQPPAPLYWTGDGGRGRSIAILSPRATGLTENQNYLPDLVQGEFVSNFTTFSAIAVLDRLNLDNQYSELLSGYYADDAEAGMDLGHLPPTDYIMSGTITRTATGYALQMWISRTTDKMTIASYSETCTFAELDNLTGIRRVSLDLLQKIGVEPTERTRTALTEAATTNRVNAQAALAQGISAQRSGTVVEALAFYYQAASFDNSLLEAANRASAISATITSGNIGENVRNDIQRRNEWKKILDEADAFFLKHLPFEIVYDPDLTQGKIDYNKQTVDLSLQFTIIPNDTAFKVLTNIREGLIATGKMNEWGFKDWPIKGSSFLSDISNNYTKYIGLLIEVVLKDNDGKQIASSSGGIDFIIFNATRYNNRNIELIDPLNIKLIDPFDASLIRTIQFSSVNANDITDRLTIQITRVNRVNVQDPTNQGYINIRTGVIPRR